MRQSGMRWLVLGLCMGGMGCASVPPPVPAVPQEAAQEVPPAQEAPAQDQKTTVFQQHLVYRGESLLQAMPMVYFAQEGGAVELRSPWPGCLEAPLLIKTRAGVVELGPQGPGGSWALAQEVPLVIDLSQVDPGCGGVELVIYRSATPRAMGYRYLPQGV